MPFKFRGPEDLKKVERDTTVTSDAVAVGDVLYLTAGAVSYALGNSTGTQFWHKKIVVTRVWSTADVEGIVVHPGQLWEATGSENSTLASDGDRMILTSARVVNNSATDDTTSLAVVIQRGVIGAAADKKLLVQFLDSSGFSIVAG